MHAYGAPSIQRLLAGYLSPGSPLVNGTPTWHARRDMDALQSRQARCVRCGISGEPACRLSGKPGQVPQHLGHGEDAESGHAADEL